MKNKLILSLFILSGICSRLSAQEFSMKDVPYNEQKQKVIYEGTIDVDRHIFRDSLYAKTFAVLKETVKGFASKIIKNDPSEALIIYNGVMQGMKKDEVTGDQMPEARIKYVVHLSATDNSLKYSFSDFVVEKGKKKPLESFYFNEPDVKMKPDAQADFFHSIDYEMKNFIKTLTRRLNK